MHGRGAGGDEPRLADRGGLGGAVVGPVAESPLLLRSRERGKARWDGSGNGEGVGSRVMRWFR